ncbi:hypothetical protein GCM10011571_34340 [Marinithermofilum abyssi]|uniref:Aldehyde oxidase/xanthine dehydrogenase first molybdopterin binding domain-containing protein n=1 Tax=Marinithermofilum abyssi TaxID=1571185 RepID=A0A8J2YFK4_9BACL|nr:molybdopterin cofactor-binding domain-containing protein [Marinithermofilum abyssi]GGE29347.1 hypothetical protein GCM10011571_34340 [Marinithermofilum abyssi]
MTVSCHPAKPLLDVLREEDVGLTGSKECCGKGECGSCSVILDKEVICSCLILAGQVEGDGTGYGRGDWQYGEDGSDPRVGTLTIRCPGQYAYRDRMQIARALAWNPERIRVISSPIGGAFGGKDEITVQIYLALLALHTGGRPVKIHYKREESVIAGIKRHPFKVYMKTAAKKDGTIIANQVRAVADTGAYASLGGAVISLAIEHSSGSGGYGSNP